MEAQERKEKIELYGRGYDLFVAALEEMPKEMWQYKPEPKEWSVHEIIVHLADSESNSALRARLLIAQPGLTMMGYDQDVWADKLDYHSQSTEEALALLKYTRSTTYNLIKDLPDEVWAHTAKHPEIEEEYSFEKWLMIYSGHIPAHIQQIRDNLEAWKAHT